MLMPNDPHKTPSKIRELRRAMCEKSLMAFAQTYFSHYCKASPSSMHLEIAGVLQEITRTRGARIAIAAPRGHAKSTLVTVIYTLWSLCYGREPYVIMVWFSSPLANGQLNKIKIELKSNATLIADFPEVCHPPGRKPGPARWRTDEILAANGAMVTALGVDTKVRGRGNRQDRPTLILIDDAEGDEATQSADRREKLEGWVNRALLKMGDGRTNVVMVGTILHYDSLLAQFVDRTRRPGWRGHRYQAVQSWATRQDLWEHWEGIFNYSQELECECGPEAPRAFFEAHKAEMLEGAVVLWPDYESYYQLMVMRLIEGRASFDAEKQNEPIDPESCLFKSEQIQCWDKNGMTEEQLLASIEGHRRILGSGDPSMGKFGRSRDDCAIMTIAQDTNTSTLYVLDASIARRTPDQFIDDVCQFHVRRHYDAFAIETVQFQEYLAQQLSAQSLARGLYIPFVPVKPSTDKVGRIQGLQPFIANGTLRLRSTHRQLLDQLRQFPKAAHDDGPDALEMAVHLATIPPPSITFLQCQPIAPGSRTSMLVECSDDQPHEPTLREISMQRFRDFLAE